MSLTQINRWKRCVDIRRSKKGAREHKYKYAGRSIADQHHNETRMYARTLMMSLRAKKA